MARLTRQNLSQSLVQELLGLVRAGQFVPGDQLPTEKQLMESFGVGRGAVREAMQSLVSMGLVQIRPRTGAILVSTNSSAAVDALAVGALLEDRALDDLYDFRAVLEVEIAGRAAARPDAGRREDIGLALDSYRQALVRGLPTYQRDMEFHQALAKASHNQVYTDVLGALGDMLLKARQRTQRVPSASERAMGEHQAIYDAVMRNDAQGARDAMAVHIASAKWALDESRQIFGDLSEPLASHEGPAA